MTPRNILIAPQSSEEFEAEFLRKPLLRVLPSYGDARWMEAASNPPMRRQAEQLVDFVYSEASQPLPELTPAMFHAYEERGERGPFDRCYLERRRLLGQVAVAALLRPDNTSLREVLFRRWEETLGENTWMGNSLAKSARAEQEQDRPDLKATEAAATLAEICAAFREVAPRSLVEQTEIRLRKMLDFYVASSDPPEPWFTAHHNWNAVCHFGIVSIGLNIPTSPEKLAAMFSRMAQWLAHYLRGFTPDGGCSEGSAYWSYGFSRFSWLNHAVETATAGRYSLIAGDPRIPKIARFGIRVFVPPDGQINFADSPAKGQPCPGLISYLANRLDRTNLRASSRILWRLNLDCEPNWRALNTQRLHFLQLTRRFLFAPSALSKSKATRWPVRQFYLPHLQVWNMRGTDSKTGCSWSVAAKGGHNDEGHNHNDGGSYVLHLDGQPLVSELGMPQYDKNFFRDRRYESLAAGSQGHSVPRIHGFDQISGRAASCTVLDHSLDEGKFSLDLTRCYPADSGCQKIQRDFLVERTPFRLTVTDSFQLFHPVPLETALITFGHVSMLSSQTAQISMGSQKLLLTVVGGSHIADLEKHSFMDDTGGTHPVSRVVIRPVNSEGQTPFIRYSLTL